MARAGKMVDMEPNPYQSPKSELPPVEPNPPEAQLAYHHPVWQRVLALGVPFTSGFLAHLGLECFDDKQPVWAAMYSVLAAGGLLVAWRWTR